MDDLDVTSPRPRVPSAPAEDMRVSANVELDELRRAVDALHYQGWAQHGRNVAMKERGRAQDAAIAELRDDVRELRALLRNTHPPPPPPDCGIANPQQQLQQPPEHPAPPSENFADGLDAAATTINNFVRTTGLRGDPGALQTFKNLPQVAQLLVAVQDTISGGTDAITAVVTSRGEEAARWLLWGSRADDRMDELSEAWDEASRIAPAICDTCLALQSGA